MILLGPICQDTAAADQALFVDVLMLLLAICIVGMVLAIVLVRAGRISKLGSAALFFGATALLVVGGPFLFLTMVCR